MPDTLPGFQAIIESEETQIHWAGPNNQDQSSHQKVTIDSTATDTGNTGQTTTIRGGNMMAILDADGNAYPYDPDHATGLDAPVGVLPQAVDMIGREGVATDRFTRVATTGLLKASECVGLDDQARARLIRQGFRFDTPMLDGSAFLVHPKRIIPKITDYTVVAADHGTLFLATTADCTFTLPTLAVGLSFEFLQTANFELSIVAPAADTLLVSHATPALSTSITWTTTAEQIGARCRVLAINIASDTLAWAVEILTHFDPAVA
jgi:hypothetical protein